ncbi:hypothetical protein HF086_010786 [Spodoptera exigua]|uniref:GS beta-grasp domain-containing protein n=1 Tax=Spodoptera exigua TaxID=7107 RepID=A0A922S7Z0_SPOEX|nr:hypothetical protein HF086_010786 [Spodoptera exigua]
MNTVPILLNKAAMRKYEDLEIPCDAILATYVWIDGSGINLRGKDRTFDFVPKIVKDLPIWYFDGGNTDQAKDDNSDTYIFPQVLYHDPFRRGSNILVLSDTYSFNYQPTSTNFRKSCLILCEKGEVEEPWFGFNQEFFLTSVDGRPLGWPPGGFPAPPGPYYCATGANKIVGPSPGIKAADDLWMARYILSRLAEEYGSVANFEPQPIPDWPGNGTFVYFSSKDMREDDGIL